MKAMAMMAALVATAVVALPAIGASAGASPTLLRAAGGAASGAPGSTVKYKYTWNYADCASNSPDPTNLTIVLYWDDSATTPIGTTPVTARQASGKCQGTVSGTVPSGATGGDHFPSAALKEPSSRGNAIVKNSNTGRVLPGQQFTVTVPPTPTPVPTPTPPPAPTSTPTPSDTPLPTDTPTALPTPAPTASPGSAATPLAAGNGRGSGPPAALLVGIAAILVITAAIAGTVLLRRRRARTTAEDPFQFLR
ncbi:MAG: hypothetical protein DLM65_02660 [Candidatus Aeolococcus gillhamiae]|nr:MAG: hypothetical protein DLM65_02660 [Candidatus Dormibacter sp. RRmetagenome_bin12]